MAILRKHKFLFVFLIGGLFASGASLQSMRADKSTTQDPVALRRQIREVRSGRPVRGQAPRFAADRVVVKFKSDVSAELAAAVVSAYGAREIGKIEAIGVRQIQIPSRLSVEEMIFALEQNPDVEYAEPDYVCRISDTPNDPYFKNQYALNNSGQEIGTGGPKGKANADIRAATAWGETKGSVETVIAIIDTGVDLLHPDINNKIKSAGRDFANDDFDATDDNGHGTHVAGIAAADTNNNIGVAGVAWDCLILPVKATDEEGEGFYSWMIDGITWATDNGADVINISLGGDSSSNSLRDALKYAHDRGVVVCASAGNDGSSVLYPAAYDAYCLAVAATDYNDTRTAWSNFGSQIDVAAPGERVLSLVPTWYPEKVWLDPGAIPYGYGGGTSMASPHVAGLAALIKSLKPWLEAEEIMNVIRYSADDINSAQHKGKDEYIGYGRINMDKALVPIKISK